MNHEIPTLNDVFVALENLLGPYYFRQLTGEYIHIQHSQGNPDIEDTNYEEEKKYTLSLFTNARLWTLKSHLLTAHSMSFNRVPQKKVGTYISAPR